MISRTDIQEVVVNAGAAVNPATVTFTSPPAEGDLIILAFRSNDSVEENFTLPSGFLFVENYLRTDESIYTAAKVAGAAETGSYQVSGVAAVSLSGLYISSTSLGSTIASMIGATDSNTATNQISFNPSISGGISVSAGSLVLVFSSRGLLDSVADGYTIDNAGGFAGQPSVASKGEVSAGSENPLLTFSTQVTRRSAAIIEVLSSATAPAITTGTITNVTTEGFQVQFTTDTANGTAYYVVYPTSATDPTAVQIVAETDGDDGAALASGNQAVSTTGVQTFSPAVTGLSPNTTYRVSVVHYGTPG